MNSAEQKFSIYEYEFAMTYISKTETTHEGITS